MFTNIERTAVLSLAAIIATRMLGLFIIIPVFSPYLQTLNNATPMLIGLTMGIYGLSQALLQIPFGILSDYIGRREVITIGLLLFFFGSVVAGSSHNIWIVLLGRALQGAGAISGTVIALLSDLTSEHARTKAMAIIGMSIGASFMLAFMFGPLLNSVLSVNTIFYFTAFLVLPIIMILWKVVPLPDESQVSFNSVVKSPSNYLASFLTIFRNKSLAKQLSVHSFGVFSLHGILMANFVALPILLKQLGLNSQQQGMAYIEVFVVAILFMVPMIIYSEKKKKQKNIYLLSLVLIILAEVIFWLFNDKFWGIMLGLVLFFTGFNVLEASLPSMVSKLAPKDIKGSVLGLYSTAQFSGPMLGGVFAGVLFKFYGLTSIFLMGALWATIWLLQLPSVSFTKESSSEDKGTHKIKVVETA